MKVLLATQKPFAAAAVAGIREILEGAVHEVALLEKYAEQSDLVAAVSDAEAMIIRSDKVTAEVLDAAPKLKIVVRAGAGYDNVALGKTLKRKFIDHNILILCFPAVRNYLTDSIVISFIFISPGFLLTR